MHHLAIRRGTQDEIDAAFDYFQKHEVNVTEKPQHYPDYDNEVYYAVFFHDPDGHRFELFYEKISL